MEVGLVRRIDIDTEMQQSYLDYAMSVIVSRALPDARDGLKPVHRRILHAMHIMGIRPDSAFKKSARIVGEVLGKYHPHGDMAVYDAMARMAQDFSMRYPIVEGQGNFGSVDGDPPAAMRYTEARLAPLAMDILSDLDKDTVDLADNFDGSLQEPTVLPAALPNLLANGATGIAVGMATSIPPHNMGEVCNALIYMLENYTKIDKIGLDDLMSFIQGPDFPTGGIILRQRGERDALKEAYGSGRGKITVQARAHIEEMSRGRSRIIVTELPFQTNKSSLIERIADLAREGHLEGLADLRDESDRQGMRIVIELTKTADPDKVIADLHRRTPMQNTFSLILLALVEGEPRLLNLKSALRVYLEHRLEVIRRRSVYELARAKERAHILEGLRTALDNLDEVIQMIRTAKDAEAAQKRLQRGLKLSARQALAILNMPLRRLSSLERRKINQEYREVLARIKQLEALLKSSKKMRTAVAEELAMVKERYADRRRTQIASAAEGTLAAGPLTATDLVPDKETWIVVTPQGRIYRTPAKRLPRLAGRAAPRLVVGARGRDTLYLFTDQGMAVAVPAHTVPVCDDPKEGAPVTGTTPLPAEAEVVAGIALSPEVVGTEEVSGYLIFGTEAGMVKKSPISALPGPSAKAFVGVKVAEGDRLGWVHQTSGKEDVLLVSSAGLAIRFSEEDVRPMGLAAAGVMGMRLEGEGARLVGMGVFRPRAEALLVAEDGQAKRTVLSQFPLQGRYGKGVLVWKSGEAVTLAGAAIGMASDRGTIFLHKAAPRALRFGDAQRKSRTLGGVPLINVKEGDRILAIRTVQSRPQIAVPSKQSAPKAKRAS